MSQASYLDFAGLPNGATDQQLKDKLTVNTLNAGKIFADFQAETFTGKSTSPTPPTASTLSVTTAMIIRAFLQRYSTVMPITATPLRYAARSLLACKLLQTYYGQTLSG